MPAVVVKTPDRHTLVKGLRQYDFASQPADDCPPFVEVVHRSPRMAFTLYLLVEDARQLWQRLKDQGYVEW